MNINEFLKKLIGKESSVTTLPMYFKDGPVYYPILNASVGKIGLTDKDAIILTAKE